MALFDEGVGTAGQISTTDGAVIGISDRPMTIRCRATQRGAGQGRPAVAQPIAPVPSRVDGLLIEGAGNR